jgi:hypothetical protein
MKMWRLVIGVVHLHNDTEEPADFWHTRLLFEDTKGRYLPTRQHIVPPR